MRLLFVFDIGFDRSGPSVHLLQDVLREALNQGHQIHVILKYTDGSNEKMPKEFCDNNLFSYELIDWNQNQKKGFIKRYLNEIKYANISGKRALRAGKFDAVFLQSNVITYWYMRHLKKLKCRIIYNIQDIFPYNLKLSGQLPMEKLTYPLFRKLQNMGYHIADKIITISEDMKQTLLEDGIEAQKIEVVYNWSYNDTPISLEKIAPENVYDLCLDYSKYNVVYAGNIGKMQNVELIARTAYEMREDDSVHFYIIGNGSNKENVMNIVEGLKNVTLLPMQPAQFAESIYAQADLNIISLVPGGIKTAFPSKTATVIRTEKPIIYCCDTNSIFCQQVKNDKQIYVSDCENESDLISLILSLKNERGVKYRSSILDNFISRKNALRYIAIMTCTERNE